MTDKRGEYIAQVRKKLDLLNARIVELEAKANEKPVDVRSEFKAKLRRIRQSKDQAERRLDVLRLTSKPAWKDVRRGVEQAWKSVADAVEEDPEGRASMSGGMKKQQ